MIRGVIFDLDGVVIDSHPAHRRAWRGFLQSLGRSPSDSELDFVLDGRKREDILRHFLGELSAAEIADYGRRKEALFRREAFSIRLIAGVEAFWTELERVGIPLAIASSGSEHRIQFILRRFGLAHRPAAIVSGDHVARGKPHPEIFQKAADCLCLPYEDLLVAEDAVAGVVGAKAAGMKCLGIASNGREAALRDAGADLIAPDFSGVHLAALQLQLSSSKAKLAAY